jgi:hypothetical protein
MISNKNVVYILIVTLLLIFVYVAFNTYDKNIHLSDTSITSFADTILNDNALNNNIQLSQDYIRDYFKVSQNELSTHWLRIIKHYLRLPLETGYGSHKLALLAASILTGKDGGPVMEMGCGYHSTVILHKIVVVEQKRYLLSTDTDREWLSKFEANMSSSIHQFRHIKDVSEWDSVGVDRPRWSIVFIDHKPGERRVVDIIRLANVSDIVIVHDTETASYNYERGLSQYPYRYHFTYLSTGTDIASKTNGTLFQSIKHLLELTISLKVPKS